MMPSEFSKSLAERLPDAQLTGRTALKDYAPRQRMIDAELQEVRAVLIQTADRNMPAHGPCWCRKDLADNNEPHNSFCQRARALWGKLGVK
jgi:hypothetical protein